jgi:hypothetical protein
MRRALVLGLALLSGCLGSESTEPPAAPAPVALVFAQAPSTGSAGTPLQIRVDVVDATGTRVAAPSGELRVSLHLETADRLEALHLGDETTVAGTATFYDATITTAGTGYVLVAQARGLEPAASAPLRIDPGIVSSAATTFTANLDHAPADGTSTAVVTIDLRDRYGNPTRSWGWDGVELHAGVHEGAPYEYDLWAQPGWTLVKTVRDDGALEATVTSAVGGTLEFGATVCPGCEYPVAELQGPIVRFNPGPPDLQQSRAWVDDTTVARHGSTWFMVELRASSGLPLCGHGIQLEAEGTAGVVLLEYPSSTNAAGLSTARLYALDPGTMTLTASVNGQVVGSATFEVTP